MLNRFALVLILCLLVCAAAGCVTHSIRTEHQLYDPDQAKPPTWVFGYWRGKDGRVLRVRPIGDEILYGDGNVIIEQWPQEPVEKEPVAIYIDGLSIDDAEFVVLYGGRDAAPDGMIGKRGHEIAGLTRVEQQDDEYQLVRLSVLSPGHLYELLNRRPELLAHENRRERTGTADDAPERLVILLKDEPAKVRQFLAAEAEADRLFQAGGTLTRLSDREAVEAIEGFRRGNFPRPTSQPSND